MYYKTYLNIIYEICSNYGIHYELINNTSILKLTLNDSIHYIWSRRFDINDSISTRIADNKFETCKVLENNNIPVVPCTKLVRPFSEAYQDTAESNFSICNKMLSKFNSIVIKPNNSYEGKNVYKCSTIRQVEETLYTLYSSYQNIVATPFVCIKAEYRAIFLNGKILLIYRKELPYIIADGKKTLIELLASKEYQPFITMFSADELNMIPKKDEYINLNWKFNLSQGANCVIIDKQYGLYSNLNSLALEAADAINIKFASIDMVLDNTGELSVLEINSGVAMDQFIMKAENGRKIAYSVYEKAIKSMFQI